MKSFVERVYYSLLGELCAEYCVPGVENAFSNGGKCEKLYGDVQAAYEHLRNRLGKVDEDEDVEVIIDALMEICEELGYRMYEYGAKFGKP